MAKILSSFNKKVDGVFASPGFVRNRTFLGLPVTSFEECLARFGNDMIVLMVFGTKDLNVISYVKEISTKCDLYIPDLMTDENGEPFTLSYLDKHLKAMVPIMSGEAYEVYVGYKLAYVGWSDITFTPVTGDYGADIIATDKDGLKVCIQCKRYDSPVGIDAVQEVIAAKQYYGANRAVVATNSVMTQQACNIAQKTGVELWERFI